MDTVATTPCVPNSIGPASGLAGLVIQTILAAQCLISPPEMWPKDYGTNVIGTVLSDYDFIVIGAGTAGSVVANRLSENPNWNILLLEAGGDPPIESEIPGFAFSLRNSSIDWGYFAERSNKSGKSLPNGSLFSSGKVLGGTSSINNFDYFRGNRRDFDDWEAMGNPTWGWNSVLNEFKKFENMKVPELVNSYGIGGTLHLDYFNNNDIFADIFQRSATEIGYKNLPDMSNEFIGLKKLIGTFANETRCSSAKAFLNPVKDRPNLHIIKNAYVTKILMDPIVSNVTIPQEPKVEPVKDSKKSKEKSKKELKNEPQQVVVGGTAVGVEFMLKQQLVQVRQRKEIILSAGTVNTPKILMLSGVGPEKNTKKFNIPTMSNLPVGKSLQDHATVNLFYRVTKPINSSQPDTDLEGYLLQYVTEKSGPLTRIPLVDVTGFFNTVNMTDAYPDIQILAYHFRKGDTLTLKNYLNGIGYDPNLLAPVTTAIGESDLLIFNVIGLNPRSMGKLYLRSANPLDSPIIESGLLKKKDDIQTLIRGIRLLQSFQYTQAFREHLLEEIRLTIPECGPYLTDLYWECYVRHMSTSGHHPVGTVKMGPITDRYAVVDSRLLVKNVKNLRVADASVMPKIISGPINAAVTMIGEKAATFIKEDWALVPDQSVPLSDGIVHDEM